MELNDKQKARVEEINKLCESFVQKGSFKSQAELIKQLSSLGVNHLDVIPNVLFEQLIDHILNY